MWHCRKERLPGTLLLAFVLTSPGRLGGNWCLKGRENWRECSGLFRPEERDIWECFPGEGRNGGVYESHTQRQCSKSLLVHLGQRSMTVLEDWTLPCHLERDSPSLLCRSGSAEQTSDWISAPTGACTYTNTIGTHPPSSQVIVLLLICPWMDFPCVQSSFFLS